MPEVEIATPGTTDAELFNSSMTPEAPESADPPQGGDAGREPETQPQPQGNGAEPHPGAEVREPEQRQEGRDEPDHRIPLPVYLEQRERAQAAERRAEQNERQMAALRREMAQLRNPPKQPDLIADPDTWSESLTQRIERQVQTRFLNSSFADAHDQHREAFDQAFHALEQQVQAGDNGLRDKIVNAHNPGRELMRWHGEQRTLAEIGETGLDGYRNNVAQEAYQAVIHVPEIRKPILQALIAEARKDPAFNARYQAGRRSGGNDSVSMPSLNRQTTDFREEREDGTYESDGELFRNSLRPRAANGRFTSA